MNKFLLKLKRKSCKCPWEENLFILNYLFLECILMVIEPLSNGSDHLGMILWNMPRNLESFNDISIYVYHTHENHSWKIPKVYFMNGTRHLTDHCENEAEMHQFLKIWLFAIFCIIHNIKILLGQEETNNFSFMTFLENWYLLKQIQKTEGLIGRFNWSSNLTLWLCKISYMGLKTTFLKIGPSSVNTERAL